MASPQKVSDKIIIANDTSATGHVLSFGSLAYIVDYNGKLHTHKEAEMEDNESPPLYPPLGCLGVDLEVLTWQIRLGLGLNPTMFECR